jgi:branched-chain amino acid transport system ATP-binding protein
MIDSPQARSALDVRRLYGGWGPTVVVEDVSLAIATGETVSIIGRNGVGKTTLLELIVGRAQRHGGDILIRNQDYSRATTYRRSSGGLGYVPQEREVFPSLTVRENLSVAQRPGPWNEDRVFTTFPGLAQRARSMGWQLSGGEQQMLSIGRALMGNPTVLLMDEPTEGLAPVIVEQLVEVLQQIAADGTLAVLLVEQRIDVVLRLASRCLIMNRGRVVHQETNASLRANSHRMAELIGLE